MIGSGVSTDSMMAASFGIIDSIVLTTSTTLITSSLSATSAFHGGGVGVLRGVGARAIRTAITAVSITGRSGSAVHQTQLIVRDGHGHITSALRPGAVTAPS